MSELSQKRLTRLIKDALRTMQHDTGPCLNPEKLVSYHMGQLSDEEAEPIREHISLCDSCVNQLQQVIDFFVAPDKLPEAATPTDEARWERFRNEVQPLKPGKAPEYQERFLRRMAQLARGRRFALALLATTAVIMGIFVWYLVNFTTEQDDIRQRYALNSKLIPALEHNLGAIRLADSLKISPQIDENLTETPIRFRWDTDFEGQLFLVIINERLGDKRYRVPIGQNQFELVDPLEPGMYYWKIENKNEALYIGKFHFMRPED